MKKLAIDWIDAKQRTPYFDKNVLVYTTGRGIQIGYLDSETREWITPDYSGEVTHWQDLPDKPIGDKLSVAAGSDGRFRIAKSKH